MTEPKNVDTRHIGHQTLRHRPAEKDGPPLQKNVGSNKPQATSTHKTASWSKPKISGLEKTGAALGIGILGCLAIVLFPITIPGGLLMWSGSKDVNKFEKTSHKLSEDRNYDLNVQGQQKKMAGTILGFPLIGMDALLEKAFDANIFQRPPPH